MNTRNDTLELEKKSEIDANTNKVVLPFEKEGEYFVESLGEIPKKPFYNFVKRAFDIVVSAVALVFLSIPMLIVAILIKRASKGTVFYSQERLGLNGKKINVIKFRTMHMNAEANGAQWSSGEDDPRIFPLGRTLRMYRIDELPQLWCILKGDLSIVGPRPERECFYEEFETYVHGFDLDEEAIQISKQLLQEIADKNRLGKINWNIRLANYLEYEDQNKYDYIIGNPPYISYYDMGEKDRQELKVFDSCQFGKFDYYYAFIEKAITTMSDKAAMVYIVPNSFLKNNSGKKLREIIKPILTDIVDFSGFKIFDDALVSTCIIKLENKNSKKFNYILKYNDKSKEIEKTQVDDKYLFEFVPDIEGCKFGDYFNVFSSVATLLNKAFILEKNENEEIDYKEKVIRKAASPKILSKGQEQFIIFPYSYDRKGELVRFSEEDFKEQNPTSYKHLFEFKDELLKTDKDVNSKFFEYGRSQALKKLNQDKLLVSTLVTKQVNVYLLDKKTIPYSGLVITQKLKEVKLERAKEILESEKFLKHLENMSVSANGISKRISSKDIENFNIEGI